MLSMIMRNINLILEIKRSVRADRRTQTFKFFRSNVNNAKFDDVHYFSLVSLGFGSITSRCSGKEPALLPESSLLPA